MAGGTEKRRAAEIYKRLQKMGCPFLEGVYVSEPQSIHELLCTPSVIRLGILEWICTRVYPPLQEQFSVLKESEGDTKMKEMAKLGFELMLCGDVDLDLIKGLAHSGKQLSFMGELLDIIQSSPSLCSNSELESTSQGTDEAFVTYAHETEELLNELFSSVHFQATLTPECNPWPADLQALLLPEEAQERKLPSGKDRTHGDYLKELEKISTALKDLKEECTFLCSSVPGGETVIQKLRLALTDFHQLIAAFIQIYENEFREHCGHPAPQLSPSGPLFQSVHTLLTYCTKELEAISQLSDTSDTIAEMVRKRQQTKESWGGGSTATIYEKIKGLKQVYETFLNSLAK
ncbi:HAUS augmin-like complex subunit 7 isoform X1 [Hyperolius riggenbachi]|uniref:HAUS augmin-like complex subunit 7 isoform X1 n=1 Tax=Hyperolius riggenbachi TaxID=752182 RepID=UPI0035A2EE92